MANYNKSFNFRNGVQVDEDDLIVRGSLVGIGTTIPRTELDVRGNTQVSGLITSTSLYVSGIATFTDVRIGAGITIYGNTGIISATFYGDGSNLKGLPTSQWVDVDPGVGYTSIYASGNVGVGTTIPTATFQVGGRTELNHPGVGISSDGNIVASGIITANTFSGSGSNITNINASNITSGTLSASVLPTEINISGIATIENLNVTRIYGTGISTFTQLDAIQSNLSGITTVGFATISSAFVNTLTAGIVTATNFVVTSSVVLNEVTANNINASGIVTAGLSSARNAFVSGVSTVGTIRATTGIVTTLTVVSGILTDAIISGRALVGFTSSTRLIVSGVSTLTTALITQATISGITTSTRINSGAVRIGYGGTNVIDTTSTNLILSASNKQIVVNDNLVVTGIASVATGGFGNLIVTGVTTSSSIQLGGGSGNKVESTSSQLILDSQSGLTTIDDNLNVTGISTFVNDVTVTTNILPDTDLGAALGSVSKSFSESYIGDVKIGVSAENIVSTRAGNLILDSESGLVTVDDNLNVTGISTFVDDVTVTTNILPDTDLGAALGSASKYFSTVYAGDVNIGASGNNTITTRSNTLVLDSQSGLTVINDDLNVTGISTFVNDVTITTNILPDTDLGAALGSASKYFSEAYVGNLNIAVSDDNKITTRSNRLILDSQSGLVFVDDDLSVSGISTFTNDVIINTSILPDVDLGAELGSNGRYFSAAYIGDINIGSAANNTIITRSGNLVLDSQTGSTQIDDNLIVSGSITINNESYFGGIVTFTQNLLPNVDQGITLGSTDKRFGAAYIDNIQVGVGSDNEIGTISGNLKLDSSSKLVEVANRFKVTGETYLTGIATVAIGLLPDADKGAYLGQSSKAFTEAYINEIRIGVGGTNVLDTREGSLILDAFNDLVVANNDFKVLERGTFVGNLYVGANNNTLFVNTANDRVGIGTSLPTTDLQIVKSNSTDFEIVSTDGTPRIALGQSVGVGNSSVTISYSNKELNIDNRDIGSININLSSGTGINTTAFFRVNHKGSPLLGIGWSGGVGINKGNPEHALDVNGNLVVSGSAKFVGVVTIGEGANQVTFGSGTANLTGNLTGNVNAPSGISTFKQVIIDENVSVGTTFIAVGIASFKTGIAVGNTNILSSGSVLNVGGLQRNEGSLLLVDSLSAVGIATTQFQEDTRPLVSADNMPPISYGALQCLGDASIVGNGLIIVPGFADHSGKLLKYKDTRSLTNPFYQSKVGINTFVARSSLDLGACGDYFIPPSHIQSTKQFFIDNPIRNTVMIPGLSGQVIPGAFIFFEPKNRLEVGIGTTGIFCGIATLTYNGSGFDAFVPPTLTTAERTALSNSGLSAGALIYNRTLSRLEVYNNGSWGELGGGTVAYASLAGVATFAQGLTGTPSITVDSIIASSATFSGNVSIAGTLTYEDVTNVDSLGIVTARTGVLVGPSASIGATITSRGTASFAGIVTSIEFDISGSTNSLHSGGLTINSINASGVVTAQSFSGNANSANIAGYATTAGIATVAQGLTGVPNVEVGIITSTNVIIGSATTQLIVNGDARITGILTIGNSSITLDGASNVVTVGTGITVYGNSGIISATTIYGNPVGSGSNLTNIPASQLTGSLPAIDGSALTGVIATNSGWETNGVGINTLSNVGIGTTNPTSKLTVRDGDISVGVSTAHGVILTSPNGTQYRLIVDDSGVLSTVAIL